MMMHQRIPEECEIMMFLLDEEYNLRDDLNEGEKCDIMLERSLD
jgi:hypothetical protein